MSKFPEFIVVTTRHTPATPTSSEENRVLEMKVAQSLEDAKTIGLQRQNALREVSNDTRFGPGTPTIQSSVFVPFIEAENKK